MRSLTREDAVKRERQAGLLREIVTARTEAGGLEARSAALSAEVQGAAARVEAAREAVSEARARAEAFTGALDALRAARDAHAQALRYRDHLQAEAERLRGELAGLLSRPPPLRPPIFPRWRRRRPLPGRPLPLPNAAPRLMTLNWPAPAPPLPALPKSPPAPRPATRP